MINYILHSYRQYVPLLKCKLELLARERQRCVAEIAIPVRYSCVRCLPALFQFRYGRMCV